MQYTSLVSEGKNLFTMLYVTAPTHLFTWNLIAVVTLAPIISNY